MISSKLFNSTSWHKSSCKTLFCNKRYPVTSFWEQFLLKYEYIFIPPDLARSHSQHPRWRNHSRIIRFVSDALPSFICYCVRFIFLDKSVIHTLQCFLLSVSILYWLYDSGYKSLSTDCWAHVHLSADSGERISCCVISMPSSQPLLAFYRYKSIAP